MKSETNAPASMTEEYMCYKCLWTAVPVIRINYEPGVGHTYQYQCGNPKKKNVILDGFLLKVHCI